MIIEKKKRLKWVLFPNCSELKPSFLSVYTQSACRKKLWGSVRRSTLSNFINLSIDKGQILHNYSKKLKRDIRRAQKEGCHIERNQDPTDVIELFQLTVESKQLNPISKKTFEYKNNSIFTKIINKDSVVLAAHSYQIDDETKRIRLDYNSSAYRKYSRDNPLRNISFRANCLLFHEDFLFFKNKGYQLFDFGGYSKEENDSVNYFKDQFGGQTIKQYSYLPFLYFLYRKIMSRKV